MDRQITDTVPWYRQFWPWVLIMLPATTVVAGIVTIIIAVKTQDGMVEDDYYKKGLAINQTFERDRNAAARGLTASIQISPEQNQLQVLINGTPGDGDLKLRILNATRDNMDQELVLSPSVQDGVLVSEIEPLVVGKWYLQLISEKDDWRLSGETHYPDQLSTMLSPKIGP